MTPETQHQAALLFRGWINQRPGVDPYNYGTAAQLRSEYRRIASQKARALIALERFWSHPYDRELLESAMRSFSGRLHFTDDGKSLEYFTGQYYPTEYRLACAVVLEDYNEMSERKARKENAL